MNHEKSALVLINPSRSPRQAGVLVRKLSQEPAFSVIETTSRKHFVNEVKRFRKEDRKHLLVWGGDGTAHDAVNVLLKKRKRPVKALGFFRGGSGNGIQDSYEVPYPLHKQISAYKESIEYGYAIDVDMIKVQNGTSIEYGQLVGLGFDARVLKKRNERKFPKTGAVRPGFLNYALSIVSTVLQDPLLNEEPFTLRMKKGKYALHGTRSNAEFPFRKQEVISAAPMIEIGTRPYYGRLFKVCPDVVCNSGFLDLYLFNFASKADLLFDVISLWKGWHHRINQRFAKKEKSIIQRFEIKSLKIIHDKPFDYHIDGELRTCDAREDGKYSLKLEVAAKAMSFLVPGVFYRKFHPFDQPQAVEPFPN